MNAIENRQYVVDSDGKRTAVLLDIATFKRLIEAEEELEDIRAYDEVKEKVNTELQAGESVTLEDYKTKK